MNVLLDNLALFREGFLGTLSLTVVSGLLAVVLGLVIAISGSHPYRRCDSSARCG